MFAPEPGRLALALHDTAGSGFGAVGLHVSAAVGVAASVGPTCNVTGVDRPIDPASSVTVSCTW